MNNSSLRKRSERRKQTKNQLRIILNAIDKTKRVITVIIIITIIIITTAANPTHGDVVCEWSSERQANNWMREETAFS